jgi:ribosome biogenesis SPOUT family RNA methylase Rps3
VPSPPPEPSQPQAMTFGGLIGDSFSRGATKTQHTFMTQQDFQQSLGIYLI